MAPNTDSLNGHEAATSEKHQEAPKDGDSTSQASKNPPSRTRTPEPQRDRQAEAAMTDTPGIPDTPESFDWEDFERRYETALRNADENEQQILKEVESLSAYFKAWASAASAHDDERAIKRLQTRRRFVNIAEDKMEHKQQHYTQVVQAFESALALLKS